MIEQRRFQSWCARAPWAAFGLAPLLFLAVAYFIACFILWSGWKIFLPGADTPFGNNTTPIPIYSFQNIYFQDGRFIYFTSPVLIGWVIGLVAARQRLSMAWPTLSLVLIACMGGTAQIQASRTAVAGGFGHISMNFFRLGSSGQNVSEAIFHTLIIFTVALLPYMIWRLRHHYARST
jgi:threonine/homoserine/homoserine lactone efflux protein